MKNICVFQIVGDVNEIIVVLHVVFSLVLLKIVCFQINKDIIIIIVFVNKIIMV